MSNENTTLTRHVLIKMELEGKDKAIAAYDTMLWKIRAGYAAVLYGTLTLVLGLGNKDGWSLAISKAGLIAITLITGFTLCALALDFNFLTSKMRVVQAKEDLMDLALKVASGQQLDSKEEESLKGLLHVSGESRSEIHLTQRAPIWPIVLLYVGTWIAGGVAVLLMT